jgi:hypothetical protein
MSPHTRAWLLEAQQARVLHVFEKVCNLESNTGSVISLVSPEVGDGPLSIVVPIRSFISYVKVGMRIAIKGNQIKIGDFIVDVSDARMWDPMPPWGKIRYALGKDSGFISLMESSLREDAPTGSLAPLVISGGISDSITSSLIIERARSAAVNLGRGMHTGDVETCLRGVRGLSGLGEGLTPSGDDFILGCLLAAWASGLAEREGNLVSRISSESARKTSSLSATWIGAAARGECSAAWHVLFERLLGSGQDEIRAAAKRLISEGHTSGADALAGFVFLIGDYDPDEIPV